MLGKTIAQMRKKRGLTQDEFARKLHVSQSAVSHWERGRSLPDTLQLFQVAEFFGVTVDNLKEQMIIDDEPKGHEVQTEDPLVVTESPVDDWADRIIQKLGKLDPENRAFIETLINHAYEATKKSTT